jgi:hypothetical protein
MLPPVIKWLAGQKSIPLQNNKERERLVRVVGFEIFTAV